MKKLLSCCTLCISFFATSCACRTTSFPIQKAHIPKTGNVFFTVSTVDGPSFYETDYSEGLNETDSSMKGIEIFYDVPPGWTQWVEIKLVDFWLPFRPALDRMKIHVSSTNSVEMLAKRP